MWNKLYGNSVTRICSLYSLKSTLLLIVQRYFPDTSVFPSSLFILFWNLYHLEYHKDAYHYLGWGLVELWSLDISWLEMLIYWYIKVEKLQPNYIHESWKGRLIPEANLHMPCIEVVTPHPHPSEYWLLYTVFKSKYGVQLNNILLKPKLSNISSNVIQRTHLVNCKKLERVIAYR